MLKKIVILLIVVIGVFLIYVAMLPDQLMVSRNIEIAAPPEVIFPYINNSKKANEWMPWLESDPEVRIRFSGPDEGVGSRSNWESSGQMGTGEAEVIESKVNQLVKTQINYQKPLETTQIAEVSLTPLEGGTKVEWSLSAHKGFLFRMIGVFFNCEKMIGAEFEKGLLKLKSQVENQ